MRVVPIGPPEREETERGGDIVRVTVLEGGEKGFESKKEICLCLLLYFLPWLVDCVDLHE